eukprot:CAMPEP_0180211724 /NCGR_PEP_ID=MMETSP0987-20121128/13015_1 /TAXON_ID=697907 /ORGANISM="non described non described, Strain CCMP2293" /LENGTH=53 /DNA_ID=CAMNT_0022169135 /DNA_START=21 /DNA_END=182 /DNA_ORIENTATION=+
MAVLGGGLFLMSLVPLYPHPRVPPAALRGKTRGRSFRKDTREMQLVRDAVSGT